jgi:hypothetical protein
LESKYPTIPADLVEKLKTYFENNEEALEVQTKFDISHILRVLPANLKIKLVKFMYRETIQQIPLVQDRHDTFYLHYLEKLKPMRFEKEELLMIKDTKPLELFFIMKGEVGNVQNGRTFGKGAILG